MPWQAPGISEEERAFRETIEARKTELLVHSDAVAHPVLFTREDIARAKGNAAESAWAQSWIDNQVALADYIVTQPDEWIDAMIPMEAPANAYGFTCPNCVGRLSQEGVGSSLFRWSYKEPDRIACRSCEQVYPDEAYPETAELVLPRTGHTITHYLNEAQRANPDDKRGDLAWHWVGYPMHISFTGIIRQQKVQFMRTAAQALGFAYVFTDDPRYAAAARDVLTRYAEAYRQWPYRDYWDTYADCDPLFAAWHDKALPIEWKRHLTERAYEDDTLDKASMLQTYWGAGRVHPSTDSIGGLNSLTIGYDLTCTALDAAGDPVWPEEDRELVKRDLLLEYLMGAEPYIGGPGEANNHNNKAPRIYNAMAHIAKALGIPSMADTALRGYEYVRDHSFNRDGFCTESPSYNNMYLSSLLVVPETLHGFAWPDGFEGRDGVVDYYATDDKLRRMYRAVLWTLQPNGAYLPLSDTRVNRKPSAHIAHMGLRRYPALFAGTMPMLGASNMGQYALFNLSEAALTEERPLALPETYFPDWQTVILRHGDGPDAAVLAMSLNPPGGHRHYDNLSIFYRDGGKTLLGDHGYVGDMPVNHWIKSTGSHNLVVVDDGGQRHAEREPSLPFMATSPMVSVAQADSNAYEGTSIYGRRIALIKLPDDGTLAVDVFRVAGGNKHAYRIYSELASSDAAEGALVFDGVDMPEEPPLPAFGSSLAREHIHGLRDVRVAENPPAAWQATWNEEGAKYRLWMLSPVDRVEASNGPGQRALDEAGRRVRYVDAVREGALLRSTFVAVHEPHAEGVARVRSATRLAIEGADDGAVAVAIDTAHGRYVLLTDFVERGRVEDIAFQGGFACLRFVEGALREYMTVGADLLEAGDLRIRDEEPYVIGKAESNDDWTIRHDKGSVHIDDAATAYVQVSMDDRFTAYPVQSVEDGTITVKDYPLGNVEAVTLPSVRYGTIESAG